jgi:ATP-dependent RNA helicase DDX27
LTNKKLIDPKKIVNKKMNIPNDLILTIDSDEETETKKTKKPLKEKKEEEEEDMYEKIDEDFNFEATNFAQEAYEDEESDDQIEEDSIFSNNPIKVKIKGEESDDELVGVQEEKEEEPKKNEKNEKMIEDSEDESEEENYDKTFFKEAKTDDSLKFKEMNLSKPILLSLENLGFKNPTPIQSNCIPVLLEGKDVCASAVTGSGKTGAFM